MSNWIFRSVTAAALVALAPWLSQPAPAATGRPAAVGPGPVLTAADGGRIFGFDINQHGNDGLLATARTVTANGVVRTSVETFDQNTGKITKVFAVSQNKIDSYAADGISAGDVGLVTHFVNPPSGFGAQRLYQVLNPVTAQRFTGVWTPPFKNVDIVQHAVNQDTTTSVFYGLDLTTDLPSLIVSNVGANSFHIIALDPNIFAQNKTAQLAQNTVRNQAVIATSPSFGAVGGPPPSIGTIDLATGKVTLFRGVGPGNIFGSGGVDGFAVDSKSGIALTATELDGAIEFYDIAKQAGFWIALPGQTSQIAHGSAIANDPLHKLFLVTQPTSSTSPRGSSIDVFDEGGHLIEILNFPGGFAGVSASIAINPSKRIGWVNGPLDSQLQSFTY